MQTWIQDYEQREAIELTQDDFVYGYQKKTLTQDELFTITMRGRSMIGIPSMLEDSSFSLETLTKMIEDVMASETKEYMGIKLEALKELDNSERHKVIEMTNCQLK